MGLDLNAVGRSAGPAEISWDDRDVMLYAIGVGAGAADPFKELFLTTENSANHDLQVLPTFALTLAHRTGLQVDMGDIDRTKLVHGEQRLELHRPIPVRGRVSLMSKVTAIEDKGSGALVRSETTGVDAATGELLFTAQGSAFIRGAGGFGPTASSAGSPRAALPERAPDINLEATTRHDQALLYRLCGDRNPLHSDPAFAARGGFSKPILHGLCTFGMTARLLLNAFAPGMPSQLKSIAGRFTKPVMPGDTLRVQVWSDGNLRKFRTIDSSGAVVIDLGELQLHAPA